MKSASEILNVSIGGFTSMRLEYLKSAAKPNGVLIPCNWTSIRCYEELEREGLVSEILNENRIHSWRRHWVITSAGSAYLSQQKRNIDAKG